MSQIQFSDLALGEAIQSAVSEKGYDTPTPIQAQAIPAVLSGKDVMAAAQTGTGKTAGFTLPILEKLSQGERARDNQVRTLVLTPTRELAAQVADNVATYGQHLPLRTVVVFGGVKINPQMQKLRGGADILIATPGRLLDLYQQNAIKFDRLEILVLDEADRMLDMGFIHDVRKIIKILPEKRQNLMFSATFSEEIRELAKTIVHDPVEVSVTPPNSTVKRIKQWLIPVDKSKKTELLIALVAENNWQQVLVFCRTKHGANRVAKKLCDAGIEASAIHGNKSQGARTRALAEFKDGKLRVLVATDIAARGIDIRELPQVVNLDLPQVAEDYVHRIGRTGRAGKEGQAVSLVCADEIKELKAIERLTQKLIERDYHEDFYPVHEVPETQLDLRPIKPKRPKKPKQPRQNNERSGEPRQSQGRRRGNNQNKEQGQEQGKNNRRKRPAAKAAAKKAPRRGPTGQPLDNANRDPVADFRHTPKKKSRPKNPNAAKRRRRPPKGDVDGNRL